jgi:hypothetical protein
MLAGLEASVLKDHIEEGRRPSRHDEVPERTWASAANILPGARTLSGTFAPASEPNCFGTVMAAAGVAGAESVWMQREPFEQWLSDVSRPGGRDGDPGTVMIWRASDGLVQHAAVTIGAGRGAAQALAGLDEPEQDPDHRGSQTQCPVDGAASPAAHPHSLKRGRAQTHGHRQMSERHRGDRCLVRSEPSPIVTPCLEGTQPAE